MLPRRGKPKGKNIPSRERGRGQSKGHQPPLEDPGESIDVDGQQFSGGSRMQLMSPQDFSGETAEQHCGQIVTKIREIKAVRSIDPEELGLQIKRKLEISESMPSRPDRGTLGKRIKLISNCFPIRFPSGDIYHYDVSIVEKRRNPEGEDDDTTRVAKDKKYRCLSTKKNRKIIDIMLRANPLFEGLYAAYDGQSNLYTRHELRACFPFRCEEVLTDENDGNLEANPRETAFDVQIKPVNKAETDSCAISLDSLHSFYENRTHSVPQETIMAVETILRHGPCLRFTPIGRSFFSPPSAQNLHPLGGGLETWFGYHQSVRLGEWGPMVNLDVSTTTFFQKGPVLQFMAECLDTTFGNLRRRILSNAEIKKISNKLKNLRIEVNHLRAYRRKYRIFKLVTENAHRLEFDLTENGRTVKTTVAAYFRDRYHRNLDFPNMPCLQVYPENKKRYFPVEVCEILEGQHNKRNLDAGQKAKMITITAVSPKDRFENIKAIASREDAITDMNVRGFGIEVSREPLRLEGRVLDSPQLVYEGGEQVKPKDGSWNMKQSKFLTAAAIKSWVLLSFANISRRDLGNFSELLVQVANSMGISMKEPQFMDIVNPDRCGIRRKLSEMKTYYGATLAVIVVPPSNKLLYGKIKQAAEISLGLMTQCIKEGNVVNPRKCNRQLVSNLCLKINAKMNGVNHSLFLKEICPIMRKPVIIIGADVNHPSSSRGIKPSLAACVGSLDSKASRYAVSIRAQKNVDANKKSIEIILDLEPMVKELLVAFYRHTHGKKPEKIVFFRDGVSEGQFEHVRSREVPAVRKACRALEAGYEPGITFLVVQKRHHVRFKPENPRDGVGAVQNVPPGTTVDTGVAHPVNFDYYLCSHYGLKGTSRPTHYTVLEDDNGFKSDDIQKLTYQLCYMSARCTKSISIPAPVMYADLAAYRARQHLDSAEDEAAESSSSASSENGAQPLTQSAIDAIRVTPAFKNVLYFV